MHKTLSTINSNTHTYTHTHTHIHTHTKWTTIHTYIHQLYKALTRSMVALTIVMELHLYHEVLIQSQQSQEDTPTAAHNVGKPSQLPRDKKETQVKEIQPGKVHPSFSFNHGPLKDDLTRKRKPENPKGFSVALPATGSGGIITTTGHNKKRRHCTCTTCVHPLLQSTTSSWCSASMYIYI